MMQLERQVRRRRQRQQTTIHWARFWFYTIGIVLAISVVVTGYFYWSLAPVRAAQEAAQTHIEQKTDLTPTDQFYQTDRQTTFYAVEGHNAQGDLQVAIYDVKQPDKITIVNRAEGLSKTALRDLLMKDYDIAKVYTTGLALYEGTVVWEVSYVDHNDRLNYVTLDYKTGSAYRTIHGL